MQVGFSIFAVTCDSLWPELNVVFFVSFVGKRRPKNRRRDLARQRRRTPKISQQFEVVIRKEMIEEYFLYALNSSHRLS